MSAATITQFPAASQPALNEIAIVAKLRTAKWNGQIVDNKVSTFVHQEMAAAQDAGKYVKTLVPVKEFQQINQWYRKACTFHRRNTLVWGSHGEGLLPTTNFEKYQMKFGEFQVCFQDAVSMFMIRLPEIRQEAMGRLGSMHNPDEFPSNDEVYDKFGLRVEFSPLPNQSDIRLKLKQSDLYRLRMAYSENVDASIQNAMLNLWGRLYGVVQRISETLADPEQRFSKTMIDNTAELIELLPQLNVIQRDFDLERMCQDVSKQLLAYTVEELRGDLNARIETATAARAIVSQIKTLKPGLRAIEF